MKNFLITTAIDYPSGRFHLGHAYEKIVTDCIARWKRINGFNVHFSTGTDCHGLKIERAAAAANKTPEDFVEEISDGFKELCEALNISNDDFIMTKENRHKIVAQTLLSELKEKGYVYKHKYSGPYCVDCETYYTEKDLVNDQCPVHTTKKIEYVEEESWFFKMSEFREFLLQHISDHPEFIWPEQYRNHIVSRLKGELRDLSISRAQVKWGIPIPFDKEYTIFVWVEALMNYLSTVDYPNEKYKQFWPGVHVIGRDIVWHHSVIWGSILRALGIAMPQVVVHGFISLKGEKLGKSTGGGVDPIQLANDYGVDALRYFLIREIPFGQDGDFTEESLKSRANNELVNEYGNLVNRVLTLSVKKLEGKVKRVSIDKELTDAFDLVKIKELFDGNRLHDAATEIFRFMKVCNKYITDKAPWAEDSSEKINHTLYNLCEALRVVAILSYPITPGTSDKVNDQLGINLGSIEDCKLGLEKEYKITKKELVFKKIE